MAGAGGRSVRTATDTLPVVPTLPRRERSRTAGLREITGTARRLLAEHGPGGMTLRAIGRELGTTASALYRYVDSYDALVAVLAAELRGELVGRLEQARDGVDQADPAGRLMAACRALRGWALEHRADFALLFGTAGGSGPAAPDPAGSGADRLVVVLGELLVRLRNDQPADQAPHPGLPRELLAWSAALPEPLPPGALVPVLSSWIRLYGAVSLEVFGHLDFLVSDGGAQFERILRDLLADHGVPGGYRPPA